MGDGEKHGMHLSISLSKFDKMFIMVVILIIVVTPFITSSFLNFRPEAAKGGGNGGGTGSSSYSVVLNQISPYFGEPINFTGVYPKVATRKIGQQQASNPQVQLDCYQSGIHVSSFHFGFPTENANPDGTLTGITTTLPVGPYNSDGLVWTSGAANCYGILYYFGRDFLTHVLATNSFYVSAQ